MASGMLYGFMYVIVTMDNIRHGLSNSIYCLPHNMHVHGEDQVSSVCSCYGDLRWFVLVECIHRRKLPC